mmetsp:Transcript_14228/g.35154  ORF Transcript_14228/g.35154 Transcript_14228/m.35154 type:complete len:221 (+) Transcript_14228:251-913(+)
MYNNEWRNLRVVNRPTTCSAPPCCLILSSPHPCHPDLLLSDVMNELYDDSRSYSICLDSSSLSSYVAGFWYSLLYHSLTFSLGAWKFSRLGTFMMLVMRSLRMGQIWSTATMLSLRESMAVMKCCTASATDAASGSLVLAFDLCSMVAGSPECSRRVAARGHCMLYSRMNASTSGTTPVNEFFSTLNWAIKRSHAVSYWSGLMASRTYALSSFSVALMMA